MPENESDPLPTSCHPWTSIVPREVRIPTLGLVQYQLLAHTRDMTVPVVMLEISTGPDATLRISGSVMHESGTYWLYGHLVHCEPPPTVNTQ